MTIRRGITSAAVLFLLLGTAVPSNAQSDEQRDRQGQDKRSEQARRKERAEADRKAQVDNQRARERQAQQQRDEQATRGRQQQEIERQQRQQAQFEQQRLRQQQQQRELQDRRDLERREQDRIQQEQARQQQAEQQRREQDRRVQDRIQQDRQRQQQLEQQRSEQARREQQERARQEQLRLEQQREQARRQQQERELQARVQPRDSRPPGWDQGKKVGWGNSDVPPGQRLSRDRQEELIAQNRRQQEQFRQRFDSDVRRAEDQTRFLQKLRRLQQARYQEEYLERLRQQQARLWTYRNYNYYNDPFFFTVANYRYLRGGRYYVTSSYGIDLINQALNYGYAEGFRAGRADRLDGWRFDYDNSYAYRDASYGYYGLYVDPSDYNYYFREGFRRGYEDGYYSRYRYGRYDNGSYFMLDSIRSGIFVAIRFR